MRTLTLLVSTILFLGSCNPGSKSKETFTLEDQKELQQNMLGISTIHDNDSNKTIYYEIDNNVYRSQFYNTSQAIIRGSFKNKTLRNLFSDSEIAYLLEDDLPTMDELQNAMRILVSQDTFWDTTVSDPIWDDCKYLAANTKYWRIYYTSNKDQTEYIKEFEKTHHFISQAQFDLHSLNDSSISINF